LVVVTGSVTALVEVASIDVVTVLEATIDVASVLEATEVDKCAVVIVPVVVVPVFVSVVDTSPKAGGRLKGTSPLRLLCTRYRIPVPAFQRFPFCNCCTPPAAKKPLSS
jgi:hypothetical protein